MTLWSNSLNVTLLRHIMCPKTFIHRHFNCSGQGLPEYIAIALLVAILVLVSVRLFSRSASCQYSAATAQIRSGGRVSKNSDGCPALSAAGGDEDVLPSRPVKNPPSGGDSGASADQGGEAPPPPSTGPTTSIAVATSAPTSTVPVTTIQYPPNTTIPITTVPTTSIKPSTTTRTTSVTTTSISPCRQINNPLVGGQPLDMCLYFADVCGQPPADAYCRSIGCSRASAYTIGNSVPVTHIIGDGRICTIPPYTAPAWCHPILSVTCVP